MVERYNEYDEYGESYGQDPLDDDTTLWAMLAHLSTFVGWIGIPFGNFLGPFVVLMVKGKESEFVRQHAKEALNFQISMFVYAIVSALLTIILIGIPMLIILLIVALVCTIKAAIAARAGEHYEYPMKFRLL